jgi:putative ABC transport system permease protein
MIKNYFKIALRNLWKHKAFSIINITGLSIGITACFFIFMYVGFELSYDKMHSKADRIYRLVTDIKTPTETINTGVTAWPFAPNIKNDFPGVESFVRISGGSFLVRKGNVKFQEERSAFADSTFFKVFDFKLVKGDPKTALSEIATIVFSESAAKKYFGNADPMGQTVLLTGDAIPAKVTGVMKDIPENSQIKADMLISMVSLTQKFNNGLDNQWSNFGASSYLLLKPGTNPKTLEAQLPAFLERRNGAEEKKQQMFYKLMLEPLKTVYLYSKRNGQESGSITNVYVFGIVAIFILLIACVNFVNLTTARSVERAKEVGIRKVVGAERSQLASQFIGESVVLCLIAFLLTIVLSVLFLPLFNQLAGKTISAGIFSNWYYVTILFITSVGIGLIAGLYPALVLSAFLPVSVLKGRFSSGTKGNALRKTLVIAQFTISIALIIGTIIVYTQMSFMQNRDLGFTKDQMLILNTNGDPAGNALKEAIATIPSVKSTANSSSVPGGGNPGAYSEIENKKGDLQIANLDLYFVDWDYVNQFKIKMVAGRAFSRGFGTDTAQAMLLNEAAVKLFGYSSPQQAVGRRFKQWGREGKIVGVMKDFHFRSLQEVIKPLSMRIELKNLGLISVKISSQNTPATLAAIESKWKAFIPNRPFSYYFLDEFFDRQYRAEQRFGRLFLNFAVLAIFISCLGLLGLASYSTLQRTREIGIRKVLGATVPGIVNLLSKDFLILVAISFLVASPLAGIFMNYYWLKGFAYRIDVSWWIFAIAGILALVIALGTISFQAIRAATSNPVKSLRSE